MSSAPRVGGRGKTGGGSVEKTSATRGEPGNGMREGRLPLLPLGGSLDGRGIRGGLLDGRWAPAGGSEGDFAGAGGSLEAPGPPRSVPGGGESARRWVPLGP